MQQRILVWLLFYFSAEKYALCHAPLIEILLVGKAQALIKILLVEKAQAIFLYTI